MKRIFLAALVLAVLLLSSCDAYTPGVRMTREKISENDGKRSAARALYYCINIVYPKDAAGTVELVGLLQSQLEFTEKFPYAINRLEVHSAELLCLYMDSVANPATTLALCGGASCCDGLDMLAQVTCGEEELVLQCHRDMPQDIREFLVELLVEAGVLKEDGAEKAQTE